jgi:hypothetical protein
MAQQVRRAVHMKISRILGFVSLIVLALTIGLFVSSRPESGGSQTPKQHAENEESSSDVIPYREIRNIPTTVCSVVKDPSAFVTRTVIFNASVESDCYHFTLLVDNSCNRGLSFRVPDSVAEQWQPIDNVMCVGLRRESKNVRGRFTGRLVKDADRSDGLFPYHIELATIQDVQIH